ncbi:MAG TPA: amidohydrolase family protein [Acidovorax sp.]|nr:amidohydrolase family protein [Acidovorax sp.]
MSGNYLSVREDWLALGEEPVLEPELAVIDAHHHFYDRPGWTYLRDEYLADASAGHTVLASVYMQALTRYREQGPEHLKPVGETEYVVACTPSGSGPIHLACGLVGHADLRRGSAVREVLDAHLEAGHGRFRGIRHLVTWDADSSLSNPLTAAPPGLLADAGYRAGLSELNACGLSYDAWLLWPQLPELIDVADAFPDLPIVLDHCGGIVRIGAYAGREQEVFHRWSASMRELSRRPNVWVKLGGLGMRINGFGFERQAQPPSSLQLAETWRPWVHTCIEAFGPQRCMFESNFPVDKGSYSFTNGWNAFKRLTAGFSAAERHALFQGTVRRVYRLD